MNEKWTGPSTGHAEDSSSSKRKEKKMNWARKVVATLFVVSTVLACLSVRPAGADGSSQPKASVSGEWPWWVEQRGDVLEIGYCISSTSCPQYAALHLNSSYFRMVYGPKSGWGTSLILLPSFWEKIYPEIEWELVSSPGDVEELVVLDDLVFARTDEAIVKSEDLGGTWEVVPIDLDTGLLHAIDVDSGKLYVASQTGVIVSEDFGESFSWSFYWTWDDSRDVDFQNGYGWLAVDMWGSRSGPNRKTPGGGWELRRGDIPWSEMSMSWVVVDPLDPENIAYTSGIGSYRTLDGGDHWLPCRRVVFSTVLDGISVAFGKDEYSQDRGETWQLLDLGTSISAEAFAKDEATGFLFVAKSNGGVSVGRPGQWKPYGLPEQEIRSLGVIDNQLLAVSTEGKIFRTNITDISPTIIYNQGAPVSCTWGSEGENLVLTVAGMISGLNVSEEVRLSPPIQNSLSASVNVVVDGEVELTYRPGETFKPVMLSSMHISPTHWDAKSAYADSQIFSIPQSGWIIQPPVVTSVFGLLGGISEWQRENNQGSVPTVRIELDQPLQVTGRVTWTLNPNDDNVGHWAASDVVLPSWSYRIFASAPYRLFLPIINK